MARSARDEWRALGMGVNFMTPTTVTYGFVDDEYVYEISEGWFCPDYLVGVSVRRIGSDGTMDEFSREWSEMVLSLDAADEWVELVREAAKEGETT